MPVAPESTRERPWPDGKAGEISIVVIDGMEEPLFLDEPTAAPTIKVPDGLSALDLFADEDDPATWQAAPRAAPVEEVALAPETVSEPAPTVRPTFLALLSLLAAVTAFAVVRLLQM